MFNSNVAPKKRKTALPKTWYCHRCDLDNKGYHTKCPACGDRRG